MSTSLTLGVLAAPPKSNVQAQRYDWKNVQIVAGGFITGITFSDREPGLAYARTDIGGAYRWDDEKGRWIPLLDWLTKPDWNLYGIEALAIDPTNSNRLYLACGTYTNQWGSNGAILSSNNRGGSFRRADLPFKFGGNEDGRSMGERLAVDPRHPNILYFGTRNKGLWTSEDFAKTWRQVTTFPITQSTNGIGITSVVFDARPKPKTKRTLSIYVGVASREHNLYHSADGGLTWQPMSDAPAGMFVHHMVFSEGKLYATFSDGAGPNGIRDGAVYRFDVAKNLWTNITPVNPNLGDEKSFGYAGLSVSKKTIAVSTLDRWSPGDDIFYSTDDGDSWIGLKKNSRLDPSAAPYMTWGQSTPKFGWWTGAVAVDPFDKGRVFYGTGANIWGCDDVLPNNVGLTALWKIRGEGIEETADIDLLSPPEGPHLITALGDIGGFTHQDLDHVPSGMALHPLLGNTDSLASSGMGDVIAKVGRPNQGEAPGGVSHDHGLTWQPFPASPSRGASGGSVAVSLDGKILVWSPNRSAPFWTDDEGASWHLSEGVNEPLQLVADPEELNTFYGLGSDGRVFLSVDGARSFKPTSASPIKGDHGSLKVEPGSNTLFIPTAGGLLVSNDQGTSFSLMAGVDSGESVGFGKAKPGRKNPAIFLNGKVDGRFGVFRSDDGGITWAVITDSRHEYGTRGVVIGDPRVYGRVYLGTNGRGVIYGDPSEKTAEQ